MTLTPAHTDILILVSRVPRKKMDFNWLARRLATEEEDIRGNKANTFIQ